MHILMNKYLARMPLWEPEGKSGGGGDGKDGQDGNEPAKTTDEDKGGDRKSGDDDEGKGDGEGGDDEVVELRKKLKERDDENARLLRESMKRKDELKKFAGIDPARYNELVSQEDQARQAKEDADRTAAEKAGDFERVKQMMADSHKKETDKLQEQIDALTAQIGDKDKTIEELSLGNSFSSSSFIGENLILSPAKARKLYGSHFEIEDGKVIGYDKPAGAKDRTKLVNGAGVALGFEAAIAAIVDADSDKNTIMKSKMKPGSGSRTNSGGDKEPAKKGDGLTGIARMRASASNFVGGK
ncbi:hypothetical protein FHV99_004672 [Ochrobactrum sp. P20RRXII]|nr:DUF6651 domain-containing protein [Ochrobactrum sp. P20RRXII]NIH77420.1 hypothetical protein [Ochrobactrum sp. P20RRXII]